MNDIPNDIGNDVPSDIVNDVPSDIVNDVPNDIGNDVPNAIARRLLGLIEVRCPSSPLSPLSPLSIDMRYTPREFAAAPHRLGKAAVVLTDEERAGWDGAGVSLPPGLTLDELVRITMLVLLPEARQEEIAEDCYRRGDTRERRAVLRALALMPRPERFVALAVAACRTNVVPEFEAIACENPFPARYFPDAPYHQMVLKALFLGVALERIIGLGGRTTPELVRMAHDYACERRAAGRSVPTDIDRFFPATRSP